MQVTIYCNEEDEHLIGLIDELAIQERKSRSAMIIGILEKYLEKGKSIGEILIDMGYLTQKTLREAQNKANKQELLLEDILNEMIGTRAIALAKIVIERCRLD